MFFSVFCLSSSLSLIFSFFVFSVFFSLYLYLFLSVSLWISLFFLLFLFSFLVSRLISGSLYLSLTSFFSIFIRGFACETPSDDCIRQLWPLKCVALIMIKTLEEQDEEVFLARACAQHAIDAYAMRGFPCVTPMYGSIR
uniref:SSD domain-containing protein n=1 Tax=Rhipicephalus pulchellus TaxID=72859 RepID=L7LWY8_RHIPC